MATNRDLLLTATVAFAGGLLSGLLLAPQSGREVRRGLALWVQAPGPWLEAQLHAVEAQLASIEQQLQTAGEQFTERVRGLTGQAITRYVPLSQEELDTWSLDQEEVARDLHLPGGRAR